MDSTWQDRLKALSLEWTPKKGRRRMPSSRMPLPTGADIRKAREERGLSLKQLSAKAGISYPALSRIETGKVTPHPSTVAKLVAVLNSIPRVTLEDEGSRTPPS